MSAATAYWHYKDRADLLLAVSRRATAALADALVDAIASRAGTDESDLSAVCFGYLQFARDHRGLFQAVVLNSSIEELMHPADSARGRAGLAAFEVLQRAVADFGQGKGAGSGTVTETHADTGETSIHVWAACHGMAMLLIDTPMATLPEEEQERLRHQHVRFVLNSVS